MNKKIDSRPKTQSLTIRLDDKTRFMLEFVSRAKGQSLTTVIERAILDAADRCECGDDVGDTVTWRYFWNASEGHRTLRLLKDRRITTSLEDDEIVSFTFYHWPFFYDAPEGRHLRSHYIEILWPNINEYVNIWKSTKSTNYWAACNAMKSAISNAGVVPPDWPEKNTPNVPITKEDGEYSIDEDLPF